MCGCRPLAMEAGGLGATTAMDNVCVVVRVRPLTPAECDAGQYAAWAQSRDSIWLTIPRPLSATGMDRPMGFDRVFGPDASNREMYEELMHDRVERVLQGYNATVMAYGQTCSGKTSTIRGGAEVGEGLIALATRHVLAAVREAEGKVGAEKTLEVKAEERGQEDSETASGSAPASISGGQAPPVDEWAVHLSYLEVYQEGVTDLITGKAGLALFESKGGGCTVDGLSSHPIRSWPNAASLLQAGGGRRTVTATEHNERSSRAHTIFRLTVERLTADGTRFQSELNLVDLAGSEKASAHAQPAGPRDTRSKEAGSINKSLLVLAQVVSKLCERPPSSSPAPHIPYRSSKLTRLLQNSLGGDALSTIVCTVTPGAAQIDETLHTLRFASRAKAMQARPRLQQTRSDAARLREVEAELAHLKREAALFREAALHREALLYLEASPKRESDGNDGLFLSLSDAPSRVLAAPTQSRDEAWAEVMRARAEAAGAREAEAVAREAEAAAHCAFAAATESLATAVAEVEMLRGGVGGERAAARAAEAASDVESLRHAEEGIQLREQVTELAAEAERQGQDAARARGALEEVRAELRQARAAQRWASRRNGDVAAPNAEISAGEMTEVQSREGEVQAARAEAAAAVEAAAQARSELERSWREAAATQEAAAAEVTELRLVAAVAAAAQLAAQAAAAGAAAEVERVKAEGEAERAELAREAMAAKERADQVALELDLARSRADLASSSAVEAQAARAQLASAQAQAEASAAAVSELTIQLAAALRHPAARPEGFEHPACRSTDAAAANNGAVNGGGAVTHPAAVDGPGSNGKMPGGGDTALSCELAFLTAELAVSRAREEAMGAAYAALEVRSREIAAALEARERDIAGAGQAGREASWATGGAAGGVEFGGKEALRKEGNVVEGSDGQRIGAGQSLRRGRGLRVADAPGVPPPRGLLASGFYSLTASVQKCAQPPPPPRTG